MSLADLACVFHMHCGCLDGARLQVQHDGRPNMQLVHQCSSAHSSKVHWHIRGMLLALTCARSLVGVFLFFAFDDHLVLTLRLKFPLFTTQGAGVRSALSSSAENLDTTPVDSVEHSEIEDE